MMIVPRNIMNAGECRVIRLRCAKIGEAFDRWLQSKNIESFAPKVGSDTDWDSAEMRTFIEDHQQRQILLFGDIEDHALLIIALLCLEQGYHLFILCSNADLGNPDIITTRMRLTNAGATFVTFPQVKKELTLTTVSRQTLTEERAASK